MRPHRFAAVVPIGPGPIDVAVDLIDSLACWEPGLAWCVFVEDRPVLTDLAESASSRCGCVARSAKNPRQECSYQWREAHHWYSGINAGILDAMAWLHANADVDFILRIDTDALAIGPFAASIQQCLAQTPNAGVLGCLNGSCNPAVRAFFEEEREPYLLTLRHLAGSPTDVNHRHWQDVRRAFEEVRSHVDDAVTNGYLTSRHCQGGACAISRLMLDRMAAAGYLRQPRVWLDIPLADDMVLAMYAYAVGLRPVDCPCFGVQFSALPYPPEELIERGYGIIHSVKNDQRFPESHIREFFLRRRQRAATERVS